MGAFLILMLTLVMVKTFRDASLRGKALQVAFYFAVAVNSGLMIACIALWWSFYWQCYLALGAGAATIGAIGSIERGSRT